MEQKRDHGGGLDAAILKFGSQRQDWVDLSTGINPVPYPVSAVPHAAWTDLPDSGAQADLITAARTFWQVPDGAGIVAAPGASALIARIPALARQNAVCIPTPTYNEHAAAFNSADWDVRAHGKAAAKVIVHPNNPDGNCWNITDLDTELAIIDESFCDVMPAVSLIEAATRPGVVILKSFGKFWGLAGLRLGFAIGDPVLISKLTDQLGPWPVSGPALNIATTALTDFGWADRTRRRLQKDADRLDTLMTSAGAVLIGGTPLFRLFDVEDASLWQSRLARQHIWSRIFPYNPRWLRLGLPHPDHWTRVQTALE